MIVAHSFDLLIMDSNSFLQLVHEFRMLFSIIHGSVSVIKNEFQPNEERFLDYKFPFHDRKSRVFCEKKNNCVTLTLVQGAHHLIQSQLGGVPHESLILLALPPWQFQRADFDKLTLYEVAGKPILKHPPS